MISIIADDKIPFLKGVLEPYASVRYMDGSMIDREAVSGADALMVRTRTKCNEALLSGSRVKFIATATIGFDHIDTVYCDRHGIQWANAPGCNASSVCQYIASVLFNLSLNAGFALQGKTLGIIGVGHVGKKVETLGRLLGMNVLLNDPPRARVEGESGFVTLERLLHESDVVTLHVPLNLSGPDKTLHMINRDTLCQVEPGAFLINSSRGQVVDGKALRSALDDERLAGAVLDVWEYEPAIDLRLLERTDIATPHIAGYSADGKKNGTAMAVRNLGAFFQFPLGKWEPSGMPEPMEPEMVIDCKGYSTEEIIARAVLHTYDVLEDNARFRSAPQNFEKQRGSYPVRREFPAYKIKLLNSDDSLKQTFRELGFGI